MEFVSSMESKLVRFKNLIYTYFQNKKKKKNNNANLSPGRIKATMLFSTIAALPRMHPN